MTLVEELATEIQKLAPSALIELFVLDATALGGSVFRFHAGTNALKASVVWQGETYVPFPIQVSGFEFSGKGQFPRPKLQVSNALSAISTILLAYDDLLSAKLTRKRTLKKFLDAVNFSGGVNPDADDTAEFPDDVYYIDRKSHESTAMVEFELSASIDLAGVQLPRRQVVQNVCTWVYRGAECGYTGPPTWDSEDQVISSSTSSESQALVAAYQAWQTALATVALRLATLQAAKETKNSACSVIAVLETQYDYAFAGGILTPENIVIDYTNTLGHVGEVVAYWNSSIVTIGDTYSRGKKRETRNGITIDGVFGNFVLYEIQRRGTDSAACTAATTALSTAQTNYDNAVTAANTAEDTYNDAFADLPEDDPIYLQERCGKRLTSCKIRFGENEPLPYGGFPASGLTK